MAEIPADRSDADWLASAAHLALRARPLSRPNPAVGALLVKGGRVIGRGWTQAGGRPHAEAMALDAAGSAARGATLYTTLEPCAHISDRGPSCAQSIINAGVATCVFGVLDPDPRTAGAGQAAMQEAGLDVRHMLCTASQNSLAGYLSQQQSGRPYITLKLATSLDGAIATGYGQSQWITGAPARFHAHLRRAMSDGILVGGRTWRADMPSLDVRLPGLGHRSPKRIVLSRASHSDGVETLASLDAIKTQLSDLQYLYVEGGASTAAAFLAADLVDQIDLYRAPIILGEGLMAIADIGLFNLEDAHGRWQKVETRALGLDVFESYCRTTKGE